MHVNNTLLALWERPLPSQDEFMSLSWNERLLVLAWLGHLAPSTHNTQPWRFYCDPDGPAITVALDRAFVLPESDVAGRQAVVSVGCAVENIICAARAYGFTAETHFYHVDRALFKSREKHSASGEQMINILTLRFAEHIPDASQVPLVQAMRTRKTMRAEFDPTMPLPEAIVTELITKLNDATVKLHLVSDTVHKLTISEFQGQADGYVLNSPRFSRELGDWLLPNDTHSHVGMPGNTFGLDDMQAQRISRGLRGESALEPEDMLRFSLGGKIGFEKSPVVAFLTTDKDDVPEWVAAGRAMERAFLILEREGISYAVHAAIVEVRLVNRIFAATLGTLQPLAAVWRMGYVKDPTIKNERPHSPRQPMESVLLDRRPD